MLEQLIRDNIKGYGILALKVKNPEAGELDPADLYQLMIVEVHRGHHGITISRARSVDLWFSAKSFEESIGLANCTIVGGKLITLASLCL